MAEVIHMPKLSDTMTEGVVAEWHKKIGDEVENGELLAEIETDKATMEFESFYDGILLHIGIEKGGSAAVDSLLCIIGEKGEDISALLTEAKSAAKVEKAAEPAVSVAASVPAPAPVATPVHSPAPVAVPAAASNGRLKASPLAKKMAEDKGIDLSSVNGSGEGGRIIKRDIENYSPVQQPAAASVSSVALGQESFHEEPVSQMRKTIARRLAESKFSAPHFYLTISIDMDNAIAARKMVNDRGDVKISFNDMVVKAAAVSLKKNPAVNSSWLEDRIRYNEHVHIGVAVAVEDGLLVPVVRFADGKPLSLINAEVKDFAQKAKNKKLQPSDWEGNTFTISNLGMFGIEEFTAIINPPDACIMAIGGISAVPVVKNGEVVPGNIMKVTLSCDHRVVDGASGAAFLNDFKAMLENPILMMV